MPRQRLSMRRIKQLLTMRFGAGASARSIAQELGIAPSTVREYLSRAAGAGVAWPLAADVTDESLMARLFVNAGVRDVRQLRQRAGLGRRKRVLDWGCGAGRLAVGIKHLLGHVEDYHGVDVQPALIEWASVIWPSSSCSR